MRSIIALLAAALVPLSGMAAQAQQKTETIRLTVGSSHPPVIPWVLAMKNTVIAKSNKALEAKGSKYRIEWNEAYGGVLYNFENTLEGVEQGLADFGWIGTLWEPAKMPLHNIMFATPFATDNPDIAVKVMDELSRNHPAFKAEWDKHNIVFFSTTSSDPYQLFTKFPVKTMADLKGKKLLAAGSVGAWIEGLGGTFVNSGIPAFYNALQTGVGDGCVLILTGGLPIKLPEVAPYVTIVDIGTVAFGAFGANKKKWESLPQEVRDVLLPLAKEYGAENIRIVRERLKAGVAQLEADKKLFTLPADERKRWADAMPNLAKSWVDSNEKNGVPARQIMKDYMEALRKGGAKPLRDWDKGL